MPSVASEMDTTAPVVRRCTPVPKGWSGRVRVRLGLALLAVLVARTVGFGEAYRIELTTDDFEEQVCVGRTVEYEVWLRGGDQPIIAWTFGVTVPVDDWRFVWHTLGPDWTQAADTDAVRVGDDLQLSVQSSRAEDDPIIGDVLLARFQLQLTATTGARAVTFVPDSTWVITADGNAWAVAQHAESLILANGVRGDANCDGVVDFGDINLIVEGIIDGEAGYLADGGCAFRNCDTNCDGVVSVADAVKFIDCLEQGRCDCGCDGFVAGYYHVDAQHGADTNPGTFLEPFATLDHVRQAVWPGDVILLRGGTHPIERNVDFDPATGTRSGTAEHPIAMRGYPDETVVLARQEDAERPLQFKNGISYWELADVQVDANIALNGIRVFGGSDLTFRNVRVMGGRVSFNVEDAQQVRFQACEATGFLNNGWIVWSGSSDTYFEDCTSHDPDPSANRPDGWEVGSSSIRTTFRRCTAYNCGDAAFDLSSTTYLEDCVAYDCQDGYKLWDSTQLDPNGRHTLLRCVAHDCVESGITVTVRVDSSYGAPCHAELLHCSVANCKIGIWMGSSHSQYRSTATIRNCISSHARDAGTGGLIRALMVTDTNDTALLAADHNCWHRLDGSEVIRYHGVDYTDADVVDGLWAAATGFGAGALSTRPYYADVSNGDLHLTEPSPCIDAGDDLGLPFHGAAPDLGAFEVE